MVFKKFLRIVLVLAICLFVTVPAYAANLDQNSQYDDFRAMVDCILLTNPNMKEKKWWLTFLLLPQVSS